MKLSREALTVLATEEIIFSSARDALDRLAMLVGPIFISFDKDRQITAVDIKEIISDNFGLDIPKEVCDALMFRLADHDFLEKRKVGNGNIFLGIGDHTIGHNGSVVDHLLRDFRLFVSDKKLLPEITDEEILQLFMERIFSLDETFTYGELASELSDPAGSHASQQWKYNLISDYVVGKSEADGSLPPLLTKLSELCLLRSVINNMTSQRGLKIQQSKLVAVFDAPLALFAIGASGRQQKKSITSTLHTAKMLGISATVYPISIDEMKRVIKGTLHNDHRNRRGLTAATIRRGEILEPIVADMGSHPEKYLKNEKLSILQRSMGTYPNEVHFYTDESYEEFSVTASRWSNTVAGEYHDAECLAVTMRARKGKHERNIFENSHVFVTSNWAFAEAAREQCLRLHHINETVCPPVVHINTFAASVWVAAGFDTNQKIPERKLLAACERALSRHENVLTKTTGLLHQLDIADEATLELLLQDRACVDAIVSQTGNDPSLINEQNVPLLLEKAKEAIVAEMNAKSSTRAKEIEAEKNEKLAALRLETEQEIEALRTSAERQKLDRDSEISALKKTLVDIKKQVDSREEGRRYRIQRRINVLNEEISNKSWKIVEIVELFFSTAASILMATKGSVNLGITLLVLSLIFVTMSRLEIWLPGKLKKMIIRWHATQNLKRSFSEEELQRWEISMDSHLVVTSARAIRPA